MASENIELRLFGQVLRLNCPEDQHADLRAAAESLESKVLDLKERSGIVQLERALAIVSLNLSYELAQEKQKKNSTEMLWQDRLQQLDHSLKNILTQQNVHKAP